MTFRAAIFAAAAALAVTSVPASAQSWPSRPVTIVVPFVAGSGTDTITRIVSEKLAARIGQPVVVENKAGAASAIGTTYVAKAEPNGYTLLMTTSSAQVILPLIQPAGSLTYESADFSPIGLTAILPNLLIVSPKVPAGNAAEFIAYAKAASRAAVVRLERHRRDHPPDRRTVQRPRRHQRRCTCPIAPACRPRPT